ncbi:MAG: hypothetical protein E5Y87_00175 [Mesorhizobium sp.]|nr:MAG: hypothetical protein E5Y87_00175 [Mesorhizobium sp.]
MEREDDETVRMLQTLGVMTGDPYGIRFFDHHLDEMPEVPGTDLAPAPFIRVVVVPQGKYLKVDADGKLEWFREVRSTGERYCVEVDGESLEVGVVKARDGVPVVIDAPEEPVFVRPAGLVTARVEIPSTGGNAALPVSSLTDAEQAIIDADLAKMRVEDVEPEPRDTRPMSRPWCGVQTWASEQLAAWRAAS